jgi:peroxiredoxin
VAVRAPDFSLGSGRLSDLKGRAVLLEFFTYGCINCYNNLLTLNALAARCGEGVAIVGVHVPKFDRERSAEALESAIGRLGIGFDVVGDTRRGIADAYALKAWPTTVLIDARGYMVQTWTGEQRMETFKKALKTHGVDMERDSRTHSPAETALRYPEKLLCTEAFLAIANSGAGSVWICGYDRMLRRVIDGFRKPMGMAFDGRWLYVADSAEGTVSRCNPETGHREVVLEALRNPVDLAYGDGLLTIALAGSHQIIAFDLATRQPTAVWGNRFEALRDGEGEAAQLAQPSGVSRLEDRLWFVDAESSSLRYIEGAQVVTAVGEGLYTFGDDDDPEAPLLLQHPQGVVCGQYGDGCGGGRVFIADTYNNKIKVYDPESGEMLTLLDTLHEPGGIAKKGCTLYIADTNAHAVIAFDLPTMAQSLFL